MRQVLFEKYGEAKLLKITEVPKPHINGKEQVLIKVTYSSLNAIDWKNRKGEFRLISGLIRPRTKQGFDVYGEVIEKSKDLAEIEIGDMIVGQLGNMQGGAFCEFVLLSKNQFIKVPKHLPGEQLGGLAMAGTTAWQAFFTNAKLKTGYKILINGGSSGVGHLAIPIAKAYGAEVTTVSSTKNLDFCKSLGADHVIDYTVSDFTKLNDKFDIVFDVVFNSSLKKVKSILAKNGMYIGTTPSPRLLFDMITSKQAHFVAVKPNIIALQDLVKLMEKGDLKVHIDKTYKMSEIVNAHEDMEKKRTCGKIIIDIDK
jgi:NADPH:quinone reductase-like Zn-dependent oxidoreductase